MSLRTARVMATGLLAILSTGCAKIASVPDSPEAAPADASASNPGVSASEPDASTSEPDASGKCGATPTLLVDFHALAERVGAATIGASGLAVDAANVYFVFNDTLMRVPIQGGAVVPMLPLSASPNLVLQVHDLLVTSTHVILHYPQDGGNDESIVRVAMADSSPTTLATSRRPTRPDRTLQDRPQMTA